MRVRPHTSPQLASRTFQSLVLLAIAALVTSATSSPTLQLLHPSKRLPTTTISPTSSKLENNTSATATITTSSPSHTWVESILIQVDRLKNDGFPATNADNEVNLSLLASSLAPTDSGEDPLETTTDLSPDDEERQLVESNNVSLASSTIAVAPANKSNKIVEQTQPPPLPRQPLSCDQAYNQCALRKACAPALSAYNDDCRELVNNRTSQCSPRCLRALIALRSSEEGDDLVQCDCLGDQYCESRKLRSQACRPQVELAVDPQTQVACSTASWICMADQLCSTAFEYYYRNCQTLFSQRHCSLHCNNSLAILYRQPKAKKLINCQCDGSEDFPCVKYKTLTERLCLGQAPNLSNNIHGLNVEEAEEEEQLDSPINMTNDPFNNDSDLNDEGTDEDFSSPQQLPEDNWIPLMTGRYFTNLHQQEQQQQQVTRKGVLQQQQQHQRIGKQKSKSTTTTNNRPHEPTTTTGRRRRLLALSSSSSSGSSASWRPLMSFVSTWWVPCVAFASVVFVSTILCQLPIR